MKKKTLDPDALGSVIFCLLGVGLVLFGFAFFRKDWIPKADRVYTTGVVSRTETYEDSDGDRHTRVYVKYLADGEEREAKLPVNSSFHRKGQEINIYYDQNHPGKISTGIQSLFPFAFGAFGLFFLLFGISLVSSRADKQPPSQ